MSQIGVDDLWCEPESVADDIFVTVLAGSVPAWRKSPMATSVSVDRLHRVAHRSDGKSPVAPADELVVARRRMRHLVPLDIKPLPLMHSVVGASGESLPAEQREHSQDLALHLLAIHMWQAAPKTALR
jgi:hypothetical protein